MQRELSTIDPALQQLFATMDDEELLELMDSARRELFIRAHYRSHGEEEVA